LIGGWAPMLVVLMTPMGLGMILMMGIGVLLAIIGTLALPRGSR